MTQSATPLTPGSTLDGLVVEQLLSTTVSAATYRVSDAVLGRTFAMKEYLPRDLARRDPQGRLAPRDEASTEAFDRGLDLFLAEGRLGASLDHPNLREVTRFMQIGGTACILMPWIDGEPLSEHLARGTRWQPRELKRLFLALGEAIHYLHKQGVLHLDIRPDNIVLRRSGEPVLIGLGAAAAALHGERMPCDSSDPFAAPELTRAPVTATPATDIYGLAATLWACLVGSPPPAASLRRQAVDDGLPDPADNVPQDTSHPATSGLLEALAHGLALEQGERPENIDRWTLPLTSLDWRQAALQPAAPREEKREWLAPMLLGGVLAVLLGALGYLLFSDANPPSRNTAGTPELEAEREPPPPPAEETLRWQAALKADTVLAYRSFLEDFPKTRYADQAAMQLDILDNGLWAELAPEDSREAYADYLDQFPLGLHHLDALKRIDEIDRETARLERERIERERQDEEAWSIARKEHSVAAMDAYLDAWPNGQYADQARSTRTALQTAARDDSAFESAQSLNTRAALQAYIDAFPQGAHVSAALALMDTLTLRPGKRFKDCPECPTMIVIPSGSFEQGASPDSEWAVSAEQPVRTVTIQSPFAVSIHEVSFDDWSACRAAGACRQDPADNGWGRGRRPVIMVSWNDAQEYLQWLNSRTGQAYRLPSESEWEYFARAGETGEWLGGNATRVCAFGNIAGAETAFRWRHEACADQHPLGTAESGAYQPNAFGLYDVVGNVAEWTDDCMNLSYLGAPVDGSAWGRGICSSHMTRGGSWVTGSREIRLPSRFNLMNGDRNDFTGFRVIRPVDD